VMDTVVKAGSNPCPPIIVGVGIGGTFEKAALMAKKALLRPLDKDNPDIYYRELETALLYKINNLGIGPQGMGGITTALSVNIEAYATHIAGLPVAVNITCHASRHMETII
jgi:fumarate hydratase subunit alpha